MRKYDKKFFLLYFILSDLIKNEAKYVQMDRSNAYRIGQKIYAHFITIEYEVTYESDARNDQQHFNAA